MPLKPSWQSSVAWTSRSADPGSPAPRPPFNFDPDNLIGEEDRFADWSHTIGRAICSLCGKQICTCTALLIFGVIELLREEAALSTSASSAPGDRPDN